MEKSRDELRICEYAVRSIASPISSAMALSRFCRTATVMGSVMAAMVPYLTARGKGPARGNPSQTRRGQAISVRAETL